MSRKVLVTGADVGLGLSLVKRFLQGGYAVFAGVRRSAADLNILVDVYGGLLTLVPLDVAEMDSVRAAARMVIEQTDAIDISSTTPRSISSNPSSRWSNWISLICSFNRPWKSTPLDRCEWCSSSYPCSKMADRSSSSTSRRRRAVSLAAGAKVNLPIACRRPRSICNPGFCIII
jgi:hypothetical protein